jgi:hypothetical protein
MLTHIVPSRDAHVEDARCATAATWRTIHRRCTERLRRSSKSTRRRAVEYTKHSTAETVGFTFIDVAERFAERLFASVAVNYFHINGINKISSSSHDRSKMANNFSLSSRNVALASAALAAAVLAGLILFSRHRRPKAGDSNTPKLANKALQAIFNKAKSSTEQKTQQQQGNSENVKLCAWCGCDDLVLTDCSRCGTVAYCGDEWYVLK